MKATELFFEHNPIPLFFMSKNRVVVEVNSAFMDRYVHFSAIVGSPLDRFMRSIPSGLVPGETNSEYKYLEMPDESPLLVELLFTRVPHRQTEMYLVAVKELFSSSHTSIGHPHSGNGIEPTEECHDLVFVTNELGRIIHVNETACRKLGYTQSEFSKMKVDDIALNAFPPYINAFKTGPAGRMLNKEGAHLFWNRNGAMLYTEHRASSGIRPGQQISIFRDVTHRQKHSYQDWYTSKLIEGSTSGLVLLDSAGNISFTNTSWLQMWGFENKLQTTGLHITRFFTQPARLALFEKHLNESGSFQGQLTARKADNTHFQVMATASLVTDPLSPAYGYLISFEDISARLAMKQELRSSNKRYLQLLESVPDAMLLVDGEGKIIFSNTATQTTFGYNQQELIGQPVERLMPEEYRQQHGKHVKEFFLHPTQRPMGSNLDLYALRKDGSTFPADIMLGPFYDGTATRVLAVIRDITKFKEAQRKLEREARFTELLHRLTIISNEAQHIREAMQKSLEAICAFIEWPLGHAYLLVEDGSVAVAATDIWHNAHSDLYSQFINDTRNTTFLPGEGMIGEVLKSGRPVWRINVHDDPGFVRPLNSQDQTIRAAFAFPILVEKEIVGVMEFFSPTVASGDAQMLKKMSVVGAQLGRVIERDRRQKLLKYNLELLSQLFQNSPVGLVMLDESERVRNINASFEQIFGFSLEEIKGKKINDFLTPESQLDNYAKIVKQAWSGKAFQFESTRLTKEGKEKPVLIGAIPVQHEGQIIAAFGMYVDLSEQKRAEQQLQESLREKEVLLTEIHHRVKNNLAVVIGLLELQKDSTTDGKAYHSLQDSQARIHSMALVHEQLYQSELFSSVRIDHYIAKLAETIQSTFTNPLREVKLTLETEAIKLTMNQAIPLGLLLNEILTNAFKHAFQDQEDCHITVRARKEDGLVEFEISDNGCGLPQNFNIAEMTSLGMSLINALTAQLDAEMNVKNKNGASFVLRFPAEPAL